MPVSEKVRNIHNAHVDIHEQPKPGMSETDKAVAIAMFWHRWLPAVREGIILARCSDMFSCGDGILGGLLIGLEDIDPIKLDAERKERLQHADTTTQ